MTIFIDNYLDLYQVVVNEIAGDIWIAIALTLFFLFYWGVKFKIPMEAQLLLSVLVIGAFFAGTLLGALWAFVVLFVGAWFYFSVAKLFS